MSQPMAPVSVSVGQPGVPAGTAPATYNGYPPHQTVPQPSKNKSKAPLIAGVGLAAAVPLAIVGAPIAALGVATAGVAGATVSSKNAKKSSQGSPKK